MHRFWRLCLALIAVFAAACDDDPTGPAPDPTSDLDGRPTVYYAGTVDQTIWRLDPDATVPVSLRTEPGSSPVGIAVDPVSRTIFWNDQISESIRRCNLDGSEPVILAPVVETIRGLAVDGPGGKLYWCDDGTGANRIQRSNLDGSGVETLVQYPSNLDLRQIALDLQNRKMYWTLSFEGIIQRANLDGSEVEPVFESRIIHPSGIAVDVSAGKLYWSDYVADKIQRSNLDGTAIEDVVTEGLDAPWTIAFDAERRVLYWMDTAAGKLQRWPVSGGPVEDVLSGLTGRERSLTFGPGL